MTTKQAKAIKLLKDKLLFNEYSNMTIKGIRNLSVADVEAVIMKIEMDARGVAHELWAS